MPINNLIQFRKGTDWSSNPTLSSGEPGFDIANNVLKIGDGSTAWSALKEIGSFAELYAGDLDGAIVVECKNSTGSTIPAGTPVYVSGYYSTNGKALISIAKANDSSKMPAIGLLESSLANDTEGYVHCFGLADQLDSSAFSVGNTVYVHPTGGLTNTRPTGTSELVQNIGRVIRSDSTQGKILILGPGRTNDVPNSGTFSILNINDAFTFPTSDGSANQVLKTDGAGTLSWADDSTAAGGGGGSVTTVKSTGVQVGGADIVTLDFSSDFSISESPDTEINIAIIKPKRYSVTSTSNTFSSFTTAETYASGQIDIFQNGIKLHDGTDFTATNGSSVTLSNYAPSGSIIEYIINMASGLVSAAFSPSDISGLQLWLDADDSDTITLNGSTVSQWNDKSGNDYNVSQGTASNQPTYQSAVLNSKSVVRFDGTNDRLFNTTAQPVSGSNNRTIFIVFSCNSASPTDYSLYFGPSNGGYGEVMGISQEIAVRVNQGNRVFDQSNSDGSHAFVTFIQNGTNISNFDAWKNGTALSATSTLSRELNTGTGLYLGSHGDNSSFLDGDIAEIIVYNSALSTSDRESVESYLSTKWGIL